MSASQSHFCECSYDISPLNSTQNWENWQYSLSVPLILGSLQESTLPFLNQLYIIQSSKLNNITYLQVPCEAAEFLGSRVVVLQPSAPVKGLLL